MLVLPETTNPPARPIAREHRPAEAHYARYRPCLRWEFGFTCAFCLLHESDMVHNAQGTGLMSVEHQVRQSAGPRLSRDYRNTFLACRFCNGARSTRPERDTATSGTLLDPSLEPWGEHFAARDGQLLPKAGDADAEYTYRSYDLDDPRKVALRRDRRDLVRDAIHALRHGPELISRLMAELAKTIERDSRTQLVAELRLVQQSMRRGQNTLSRFKAVPADADSACRCSDSPHLPSHLAEQCVELDLDLI